MSSPDGRDWDRSEEGNMIFGQQGALVHRSAGLTMVKSESLLSSSGLEEPDGASGSGLTSSRLIGGLLSLAPPSGASRSASWETRM